MIHGSYLLLPHVPFTILPSRPTLRPHPIHPNPPPRNHGFVPLSPSIPLPTPSSLPPSLLKPLLSDEELEHTKSCVNDFQNGVGQKLQAMLQERGAEERNWLEEWWEQFAYLSSRDPVAVHTNYHGVLPGQFASRVSQV